MAGNPWLAVAGAAISGTVYGAQLLWDKVSGKLGKLRNEIRDNVRPILDEFESETKSGGIKAIDSGIGATLSTLHKAVDKAIQRYSIILDRLVKPHRQMRRMLEERRDRLHDDAIRLRASRELVVDSLQRLETELKGEFSYYPNPQWQVLEKEAGGSGMGSGEDSVIPMLPTEVIDFRSDEKESSSFHRGAVAGNAISSATRQPLVLAWTSCLLVSIGLTVASLKAAGALPSLTSSGEVSPASLSSAANPGADRTGPNAQAANQGAKPSTFGAVANENALPVQESQDNSSVARENPSSEPAPSASGSQEQSSTADSTNNSGGVSSTPDLLSTEAPRTLNSRALQLLAENPPDLLGAKSDLEAATRLAPSDIEIQNNLGDVYGRLGDYRSAESVLTWVVSVAPTRRVAQGNLGYVEAKMGRVVDASNHFCQYIRLFKTWEQGKSTLVRVMNDPDPNLQRAVNLALNNCSQ